MNDNAGTIARAREFRDRLAAKIAEIDSGQLRHFEGTGPNQRDITTAYRKDLVFAVEQADQLIKILERGVANKPRPS